jgi:transposase InsO family protein
MNVKLHANATTTPRTRADIQASQAPVAALARELGVSETTVRRWRRRTQTADRSHAPHRLATNLSSAEETLIGELRRDLGLSLDDIVEVMRRCVDPSLSRSAIYRCLRRLGVAQRPQQSGEATPGRRFPDDLPCGFLHIDLKHLTRLQGRPAYVFVAIDRATRFVHIEVVARRDAATIAACLERFLAAFPHPVHTILTDNGAEFTDRFAVDMKRKPEGRPSGRHPFDRVCARAGIEHRLTRPFRPQTNGMVERFNRRLAEALRAAPPSSRNRGKNRFDSQASRNAFLERFVQCYNRTRLRCLDYQAPLDVLTNLPEYNTKAGAHPTARPDATPHRRGELIWAPACAGATVALLCQDDHQSCG